MLYFQQILEVPRSVWPMMGEMLLGFAGSNTVAWDRFNIQIHEVVTAQNSVPGIKEIQVGYSYLFLENPTD